MRGEVEIFVSSVPLCKSLCTETLVKVVVNGNEAVLTAGEWSRMVAHPQRAYIPPVILMVDNG